MTDTPNMILHTAGWGRVNGPFGKANTDMIKKKNITQSMPDQMFSWLSCSSLHMNEW